MRSTVSPKFRFLKKLQRFDWVVITTILLGSFLIAIVLWQGDRTILRVTNFSWEGRKVGVHDRTFSLSFNRPVASESVEKNLTFSPPLRGKIAWNGQNFVYTLTELPIYGINYQLKLQEAKKLNGNQIIEPFSVFLSTRDRAFAYIGVQGEERGRLIIYNITQQKKTILTAHDLVVTHFEIYPQGEKILFSAFDPTRQGLGLSQQTLYTVTTGLNIQATENSQPGGKLQRILDAKDYENLDFDLSDNGQTIVILRKNRQNPAASGLWVLPENNPPRPLGIPGGEFIVSPDGTKVAITQRGGVGILPLTPEAGAAQFLSGYEKGLAFSQDGRKLLLVRNNPEYTRSLVLLNSNGMAKVLFTTINPIISCKFEPREEKTLYCLKTDLLPTPDGKYREESFLSLIDTETTTDTPLLGLPNYRDVRLSMSPDGIALLFDQIVTTIPRSNNELMTDSKQAIADGRLWILPLPDLSVKGEALKIQPEELNSGFQPQWLP